MTEPVTLPSHPEPHTYVWTKLELEEIEAYGKKCFEAGSKQAEVAALPVQPDAWQPIETAPRDGTAYLAYASGLDLWIENQPDNHYAGEWYFDQSRRQWRGHAHHDAREATNWMPLPKEPTK